MGGGVSLFPDHSWVFTILTLLWFLIPIAIMVAAGYLFYRLVRALERIAESLQRR